MADAVVDSATVVTGRSDHDRGALLGAVKDVNRDVRDMIDREKNSDRFDKLCDKLGALREDTLLGFKDAAAGALSSAHEAERAAGSDKAQLLLLLKDQELSAERRAAQSAREMEMCCCELKERIAREGVETRDLINKHEAERLRERASKAESMLNAYYAAHHAPSAPI